MVAGIAVVMLTPIRERLSLEGIKALIDQMKGIWYAPLLFITAFAVGSVLWVPASVFIIPAGLVWGWKFGFVYSVIGGALGALITFALAKYVGEGFLHRFGDRGARIARKLDHAGFKTLLILRLIPLWPFPLYNYAAGLADVRYRHYIPSTLLGICPAIFIMTYSADALITGTLGGVEFVKRLLIVGLLVALLILVPGLFRKRAAHSLHLDEEVEE